MGFLLYRDLAMSLIWRELVVRYKRSVLGIGWALAEPVVVVGVYVAFFGGVLQAGRGITNYALFTLLGLLPWLCLSSSLEQSTSTLLEHSPLIRKVYFPRELLVFAVIVSRFSTLLFGLALGAIVGALPWITPGPLDLGRVWLLPCGIVALAALTTGAALTLSSLQVILRDTGFLLRFGLRLAFYVCPIVYPLTRIPDAFRTWFELNPLVGVLYAFQAVADPGVPAPSWIAFVTAGLASAGALAGGWWSFHKLEPTVSDLL
jgi:lipopolysaccharide transport system permease protein